MNWNLKLFREMMINFLSYYFWFKVVRDWVLEFGIIGGKGRSARLVKEFSFNFLVFY